MQILIIDLKINLTTHKLKQSIRVCKYFHCFARDKR